MDTRPAVAVAVITCRRGVLMGRRRDGMPPWAFPGGVIEPGETAQQAAVRETAEETGLTITITAILGDRTHPTTGHRVIYLAASLIDDSPPQPIVDGTLTELRWIGVDQLDELMPNLHPPVLAYLLRKLRPTSSTRPGTGCRGTSRPARRAGRP